MSCFRTPENAHSTRFRENEERTQVKRSVFIFENSNPKKIWLLKHTWMKYLSSRNIYLNFTRLAANSIELRKIVL